MIASWNASGGSRRASYRFCLEAMRRLMQNRTCFMVAHRLNTLDLCDVRLALENGRLLTTENRVRVSAGG